MRIQYHNENSTVIVYDGDRLLQIDGRLFDPSYWKQSTALIGQAAGRGTTWFVQQGDEQWALRHYKRGGLVARFITDHYLWLGLERSRAWCEWHLTADLHRRGLPVPAPVAARVMRKGLSYRADIITVRIPDAIALSRQLQSAALAEADWKRLGAVLRRFHEAGLDHADLNAHNILLTAQGEFCLIDFDRARLRVAGDWQQANLQRLHRSFKKIQGQSTPFYWTDADWASLHAGYEAG